MKRVLLIIGIASLIAGVLSLLYSALYWLGYPGLVDGPEDLYRRLQQIKIRYLKIGIVFVGIGMIACVLTGCSDNRYKIDYDGNRYIGAKRSYRAGEQVKLTYSYEETGASIYFYLDDEKLNVTYDDQMRFVITFTMPEHDVKLHIDKVAFTAPVETEDPD